LSGQGALPQIGFAKILVRVKNLSKIFAKKI
jgi:hypothetical protein